MVTDHPYKPGPGGLCDQITAGWAWSAFDPIRCRKTEDQHGQPVWPVPPENRVVSESGRVWNSVAEYEAWKADRKKTLRSLRDFTLGGMVMVAILKLLGVL